MTAAHFGKAYETGIRRTMAFLISRGVANDDAEEVAQAAWLRGWERIGQLRNDSMLITWINAIALNHYRRALRTKGRYEEWKPAYDDIATTVLNWAAIDVSRILQACKPKDRYLLRAHLSGESPKDLARREGVTSAAIRIRMLRARRSARELCQPVVVSQAA
jgi:RNA polymerase sigma factor (sigma-70 family)